MNKSGQPEKRLNRNQIAREIFGIAESIGMSDRQQIEQLTRQVIEHLERQLAERERAERPLPGMEHLVPKFSQRQRRSTRDFNILSIVKEFLDAREPAPPEEVKPKMEMRVKLKAKAETTAGLSLTENALHVLRKRYLKKDKEGQVIETPEEMFRRVAQTVASAELNYNPKADVKALEAEFYQLMTSLDFLPNSPTLMNAGRELGQLSACFVLPIEDSMESIFEAVKNTALIHKSGGGTGFSFSRLRPEKDRVGSTGGVASGPVSFMRAFDTATDVIKQGGMRRGANMAILNVDHPDIMKFITAKEDPAVFTNFNLSVAVTSQFMEAVKAGTEYNLINPSTKQAVAKLNAKDVFDQILAMAWKTGDPGIVFIDRINQDNPTPKLGSIESTNPCGEQPLLPYESCNLGSINLNQMLRSRNGTAEIDYEKLARTVKTVVRFLDNVIDVNKFPLPQIAKMTRKTRKIGLGIMGFADMLIQLGIPYDSEEALGVGADIMQFVSNEARQTSAELAKERGVFPAFEDSIYNAPDAPRVRNASCTTIAPTGTLSIIAGCSSGIEPLFALSYTRNILDGAQLIEVNPHFDEVARKENFYSEELMKQLASGVKLHEIEGVPDEVKRLFITAHDISPEWHVRMQAAFQKSTDNAVSKTVNFPKEATKEDIAQVYLMAYELGLKGITIYRDGSREGQVLTTGKKEKEKVEGAGRTPRKRDKTTKGITEKVTTGCGNMYVTMNWDEEGICEVFSTLGKAGGCATAQLEATCRLISLALRSGVDVSSIVRQLRGIRCPNIAWEAGKSILSCADAIASVLEKHTTGYDGKPKPEDYGLARSPAGQCPCPDCGGLLAYQEGCFVCHSCGYTKC
ncbi:MAG TPA: vitamin B12-dependent ribonucleotide reductase [Dehalococcoidales bacterium]|nr:vitamin B12-dependent ribonucleotide reductase [Dehalococcoidales bacterium]